MGLNAVPSSLSSHPKTSPRHSHNQAECDNYKHVQDLWTIWLKNVKLKFDDETVLLPRLTILATKGAGER